MLYMAKGKYQTRIAESQADIEATQQLRYRAFGLSHQSGIDCDSYDEHCHHFLIEDRKSGALVCCFPAKLGQITLRRTTKRTSDEPETVPPKISGGTISARVALLVPGTLPFIWRSSRLLGESVSLCESLCVS